MSAVASRRDCAVAGPYHAVARLVPRSVSAQAAIKARVNHGVVVNQPTLDGEQGRETASFLLMIETFLGRRSFSFGTSRRNELVLSSGDGLDAQHLHLHFELHTSLILLTDTSEKGTWIRQASLSVPKLLRQQTWPILSPTSILLGDRQQYHFQIQMTEDQRHTRAFHEMFRRYISSLEISLSLYIKGLASIQDPQVICEGTYFQLHAVGPATYERINTCLRLSDGRLFALKSVDEQNELQAPALILKSSASEAQREAGVLRDLSHPHVIRFVHYFARGYTGYICTEFIPSGNLASMLTQAAEPCLGIDDVQGVLRQCLGALKYLHGRGIAHGSIRAESILIQGYRPLHVRLCNFGRSQEDADATSFAADLRDLGRVMVTMLDRVVASPILPTSQPKPWATLLAGLQQRGPKSPRLEDCLTDMWLSGKEGHKRSCPPTEETLDQRAVKRLRRNSAQAGVCVGEGMVAGTVQNQAESAPSRWGWMR